MVTLSRPAIASPNGPTVNTTPAEAIIAKIFYSSFEPVTEVIAVLSGSPQKAESLVARTLGQLATPRLVDDPERNFAQLRTRSIEALRLEWDGSPTTEELQHSPLAMVRSLPFEQAVAFVIRHYSGEDYSGIASALRKTEAGARHHYQSATATILQRLIRPIEDLVRAFTIECGELAVQVDADPEILARVLRELPSLAPRYRKSTKAHSMAR